MAMKPITLIRRRLCAVVLCLLPSVVSAGAPPTPPPLEQQVATLENTVAALQAQVTDLQSALAAAHDVLALSPYVTVDAGMNLVRFAGVNIQLVNGTGQTDTVNGRGNLIIGYDLPRTNGTYFCCTSFCSDGQYPDQETCEATGQTWAVSHKTGSHYLVIADRNNYAQYGGLVVGTYNTSTGPAASVTGGRENTASGHYASVSGGEWNAASGFFASVSGGDRNTASGSCAHVSGGYQHSATGPQDWVAGGLTQDQ
jgi:hypothetical protein